jgi:hypothetical protein
MHRYEDSLRAAEKAHECLRDAKTVSDVAYAYTNMGEWAKADIWSRESIALAQKAIVGEPEKDRRYKEALRDSLIHQVYCQLAFGNWVEGFKGYRMTMRTKWRKEYQYGDSQEWWGDPDAVVMVTGEQGLGDEIMAASVVPDAIRGCKKFILDCDHRLVGLFRRSFPDAIVTGTRREQKIELPVLPTHHKSMFGLQELFRKTDDDFPRKPYLVPRDDYVRAFKALFGVPTIGIAWSGGFARTGLEQRSAGLAAFLPLLRRGGQFVSLQYKDDEAEVAEFEKAHGIKVLRFPWATGQGNDADLLAGLLGACDEVIGVHTSSLHLASAMGVPTTILTHRGSGWRYARHELPWYPPTTQTFAKRAGESWRDCVGRLVEARK